MSARSWRDVRAEKNRTRAVIHSDLRRSPPVHEDHLASVVIQRSVDCIERRSGNIRDDQRSSPRIRFTSDDFRHSAGR